MRKILYPVFFALVLTASLTERAVARISEPSTPPVPAITIAMVR